MFRIRACALGLFIPIAASLLLVGPALAGDLRGFRLTLTTWDFTGFTCLTAAADGSCMLALVTTDGMAESNIAGIGTYHGDLLVDWSVGSDCNVIDETNRFGFAAGSIYIHSIHQDCPSNGLYIRARFSITGGTGAYLGTSGSGLEFGTARSRGALLTYNGQIVY